VHLHGSGLNDIELLVIVHLYILATVHCVQPA